MNRWIVGFNDIQNSWIDVKQIADAIQQEDIDDEEILIEMQRTLEVINFIDRIWSRINPALVPLSFLTQASSNIQKAHTVLMNFESQKSLQTIKQVNTQIDALLALIYPYILTPSLTVENEEESLVISSQRVSQLASDFMEDVGIYNKRFSDKESEIDDIYQKIKKIEGSSNSFAETFLDEYSPNDMLSIEAQINDLKTEVEKKKSIIDEFYNNVFEGDNSIQNEMEQSKNSAFELLEKIEQHYEACNDRLAELMGYYHVVFKDTVDENGKTVHKGLKEEIDSQRKRYEKLKQDIETLLPGATSAGLASAYHDLNKSYDKPIKTYTWIFYVVLTAIILISLYLSIDTLTFSPFSLKLREYQSLEELGIAFAFKIPILIPAIWLAFFSANRRKESERLKQEYAHKEALAKSYEGFKIQIEQLDDEKQEPLLEKLLTIAIDTIGMNASFTLDRPYKNDLPSSEISNKLVEIASSVKKITKND